MTGERGSLRWKWPKVDPFAACDIARERHLTANQLLVFLLLAIQAEYRSSEWAGTLTDLAAATRLSRKTVTKVVVQLAGIGLLEPVVPFHQGTEGRVKVIEHGRLVNLGNRSLLASDDANQTLADGVKFAPSSGQVRVEIVQSDANDQGIEAAHEVRRQRGMEVSSNGLRCGCGEEISGHPFLSDHEPIAVGDPQTEAPGGDESDRAAEVVELPRCASCGRSNQRLVEAYWGPRLCPTCCAAVVAANDAAGDWPTVDWESGLSLEFD
ncbi:MAG: hypothetical protein ACLPR9_20205 [Acidimicrobiales bacterium]